MDNAALPHDFIDLSEMAGRWARPSEGERSKVRWEATIEEFKVFYEAVMPRLDAILVALSDVPSDKLDPAHRELFYLACAFAEAAPHHELYRGSAKVPFSFDARRFVPSHGEVDTAAPNPG